MADLTAKEDSVGGFAREEEESRHGGDSSERRKKGGVGGSWGQRKGERATTWGGVGWQASSALTRYWETMKLFSATIQ